MGFAEQVRSEADAHARSDGDLDRLRTVFKHVVQFAQAFGREIELLSQPGDGVVGGKSGNEEAVMLCHDPRRRFVDEVAVLNGTDTCLDRLDDRFGNVGVREDVGASCAGLGDGCPNFLAGVLHHVDRVGGTRDAATGHDLDLVGTVLKFLACRPANCVDPVGDVRKVARLDVASAQWLTGARAVAVPTGLAEYPPRPEDPRAIDQTGINGFGDPFVQPAGIADGGEAASQHGLQDVLCLDSASGGRTGPQFTQIHGGERRMYVRIDESGKEHAIPGVNPEDFVVGGERPTASSLYDAVALHADRRSAVQLSRVEIEQGDALNEQVHLSGVSFMQLVREYVSKDQSSRSSTLRSQRMKKTARLTGPLAAVLGGIAVITAPIANADSMDDAYLQALRDKGITWPSGSDQTMLQIGHAVCGDWSKGFTFDQTLADAKSALPQLADASIAKIMGLATGTYCPQYSSKFD